MTIGTRSARALGAALGTAALALALVPAVPSEPARAASPPTPNIVVIVTDDQRDDNMRYMPKTRRYFKDQGTTFRNAFVTTPVCCPARASILTGQYAHNHGVETSDDPDEAAVAAQWMIQRPLRQAGYATAFFGKFVNHWDLNLDPPDLDQWAIFGNSAPNGYWGGGWNVDGQIRRIDKYSTTFLKSRAVRFVEDQEFRDDRPWFLYIAPAAPHPPFDAERRYIDARIRRWKPTPAVREQDLSDKPFWVQQVGNPPRKGQETRAKQLRTLMSVDDLVGSVMDTLQRNDEDRDTLAIFTSDNGYMWSDHGLGSKRWPYEPSVEVPLLVRWPGRVTPGSHQTPLVANIDIAPTLAQAAGVELPTADGRSLFGSPERERLLLEYVRHHVTYPPTWAGTLTKDYQYVEYYDEEGMAPIYREYYDLEDDPWQLLNVLGDLDPTNDVSPERAAELSVQLADDRGCAGPQDCP